MLHYKKVIIVVVFSAASIFNIPGLSLYPEMDEMINQSMSSPAKPTRRSRIRTTFKVWICVIASSGFCVLSSPFLRMGDVFPFWRMGNFYLQICVWETFFHLTYGKFLSPNMRMGNIFSAWSMGNLLNLAHGRLWMEHCFFQWCTGDFSHRHMGDTYWLVTRSVTRHNGHQCLKSAVLWNQTMFFMWTTVAASRIIIFMWQVCMTFSN